MIYVIDEDINQMRPFVIEMEIRGYAVKQIGNADLALEEINSLQSEDLLLVDVMLATNPDEKKSRFDREKTMDFKITGICLVNQLFKKFPIFPKYRAILFTQASSESMRAIIRKNSSELGCTYFYKNSFDDPMQFGDKIEKIIKGDKNAMVSE
jgi:hypothetical protein